ncbi:MAG TPA: HupE / UreJ protein [Bacteroidales bacterium]|nr:MAG: hypothetical protein A2W98_05850 [Bacteroidetes bacterium GWF2_33_38]OFY68177.1 MAG: hypothetical protein A2265_05140 [Bacteroidetes bacterium RIFOXYA12_FULL_33_9]OFY92152.1 MAG: hypothetical protein A2236_07525 [Bacteroidetes bacterium RIFOXYA2_FULL_33_7]HBF88330.1 HupE / UreJ protein [Bacteroidales bacterium]
MSIFNLYLSLGFDHIADFAGYDHILFILTLCTVYSLKQWKNLLVLITAFTVGHSITLVLGVLNLVSIPSNIIEFLIAFTIFITSVSNFFQAGNIVSKNMHRVKYLFVLFFGLIHGLGFSNYLRSFFGQEESFVLPLFAFNVGIELGQIIIVSSVMLILTLATKYVRIIQVIITYLLSTLAALISIYLMIERF